MHPRNKLRLMAGIPIDVSLEVTPPKEQITEAREVPNRKTVAADPANLKKKQAAVNKACQHLRNAVKALEGAPATDTSAEIPQMIGEIEELCSELENMSTAIVIKEGSAMPGCENEESSSKPYTKDAEGKTAKKKYPGEENCAGNKKNKKCDDVMESEIDGKPTTSQQFADGDIVLYDDGIYVVVLSDPQADMVGIIPAGLANASADEKNRSVEMVKPDKVRKPTDEEMAVMKQTPEQRASIDDDMAAQFSMESVEEVEANLRELWDMKAISKGGRQYKKEHRGEARGTIAKMARKKPKKKEEECEMTESTHNYAPGNQVSHKDVVSDPINVVGQGDKQWANSLDPKMVKSEIPSQLDQRGDASMDDYETKVKVPAKMKSDLRAAINKFRTDADKQSSGHTGQETAQMYMDTADAFETLLGHLEAGTLQELKKAQLFATSLMGPMFHKIPDNVWDFIVNGGQKRSLKDYMIKVGK